MKNRTIQGFTIIEVLTVLAITSILLSLSITAIQSLSRSSGLTQGASTLASLVQRAQVYAMANSTYVYLGLDSTSSPGNLYVSTLFSPTAESANTSNLVPVGSVVLLSKVNLAAAGTLPTAAQSTFQAAGAATGSAVVDATTSQIPSIQVNSGGQTLPFAYVIKFAPDGAVTAQTGGISRWIQIGLAPASAGPSNSNAALVQITGLTGSVQVFRP